MAYDMEGGNKGGPAHRVKGPGQPMKKSGYRQPFDGKNEIGENQLAQAKRHARRGSGKQNTSAAGYYGSGMSKNEMT